MDERDTILKALLGEANADEAARAAELTASPSHAPIAAGLSQTLSALNDARALDPSFTVRPDALAALYAQAPRGTPSRAAPLAARLAQAGEVLVAMLTLDSWRAGTLQPAVRGADGSRRLRFELDSARIDVKLEPSAQRLDEHTCVGRVTAPTSSASLIWCELDTGTEHAVPLDSGGFFDLTVCGSRHQLEVRSNTGTLRTPVIDHARQGRTEAHGSP